MGVYSEYLDKNFDFQQLNHERKRQLKKITKARGGRDALVFAADFKSRQAPITYSDILPISDQLDNLSGSKGLDLILESPGGSGEVVEDIVHALRNKYDDIGIIIPGWAKSAATIMVMAADEILMEPVSAVGPIDAQLEWQGKRFSADALIKGLEKIKTEVTDSGQLNKAYIPILQLISPGDIQNAENALDFAKRLVKDWLVQYKFRKWDTHSSTGQEVTDDEKKDLADTIANKLCDHSNWLMHGASIKINDLEEMGLKITDYSKDSKLADAIRRYFTLLQMTFDGTNIFKIFETPISQIVRMEGPRVPGPPPLDANAGELEIGCKCGTKSVLQINLGEKKPLKKGSHLFPKDNIFKCLNCGAEHDLSATRRQVEAQTKKKIF